MSQQQHRIRRTLTALSTAVLVLLGTVAFGTAAHATGDDEAPTSTQVANINPDTPRSLTVHKFKERGLDVKLNPDGSSDTAGYTGLSGVEFTATKVNGIDLMKTADWGIVQNLTYNAQTGVVSDGTTNYPLGTATSQRTVNGETTFSPLDLGVYLVTEGDDIGDNHITGKAAPFFVTLPLPDNNSWLYDVHVYPKNQVGSISKAVDSSNAVKLGDTVTWTVTAQIPQLPFGQSLASFSVTDAFDARLENVTITSVKVDGVEDAGAAKSVVNNLATITPTLATVNANQGKAVEIVVTSTVKEIGDGTITNQAFMHLPNSVSVPSNVPFTKWGAVKIEKYAAGQSGPDTSKPLNGAKFKLYKTQAEAQAALDGNFGTPVWEGETAGGGTAMIPGLYVGDSTDKVTSRNYYLVETEAPAGFTRTATVIEVTVTPGSLAQAVVKQVGNPQRLPVALPLTGSTGTAAFMAGGLALVLVAGGILAVSLRRRQGQR